MRLNRMIQISGNAPLDFPADIFFAILWQNDDDGISIPILHPYCGEWGEPLSVEAVDLDLTEMPKTIDMVWLSVFEKKFYSIEADFPDRKIFQLLTEKSPKTGEYIYDGIVVGMAPLGRVAIWVHGIKKSVLVSWLSGVEVNVEMSDFAPMNPNATVESICYSYIQKCPHMKKNLQQSFVVDYSIISKIMRQYCYRYDVLFSHWNKESEEWEGSEHSNQTLLDYIEESLYDGTHDKMHGDNLTEYHNAGIPYRLAIRWHIATKRYEMFVWFDRDSLIGLFDDFYTYRHYENMDLVIMIDTEEKIIQIKFSNNKANYFVELSSSMQQMIIFKSGFEYYRSSNYKLPSGSWIW